MTFNGTNTYLSITHKATSSPDYLRTLLGMISFTLGNCGINKFIFLLDIFSLFASESGSYVVREEMERMLHVVDGKVPDTLRKCFSEVYLDLHFILTCWQNINCIMSCAIINMFMYSLFFTFFFYLRVAVSVIYVLCSKIHYTHCCCICELENFHLCDGKCLSLRCNQVHFRTLFFF